MEYLTTSVSETQELAEEIIKDLASRPTKGALVLALSGELGVGKTAFTQGLGQALGISEKILSPTFVIMKHFNTLIFEHFSNFYHIDAYRLESAKDTKELGLDKILKDKNNLVAIEWAERIAEVLPSDTVWIEFKHKGEDLREIKIS